MRKPDEAPEREGGEPFLSRWARKKDEAREAPPPAKQEPDPESPAPELPPVESLTPESDYRPFFHPKVDEDVRRAALKKLFTDPHFNVMDGLDTYIDDYSKTEPIPPAMLAMMKSAQDILRWAQEDKDELKRLEAQEAAAKQKALEPPAAPSVAGTSQVAAPQAAPAALDAPKDA
jgi:hypothetical protein